MTSLEYVLDNYLFKIIGKIEMQRDEAYTIVYVQTFNNSTKEPLQTIRCNSGREISEDCIFAVYASQSQMGFFRLASHIPNSTVLFDKGRCYSQTTLIHFGFGHFIHGNITIIPVLSAAPYTDGTFIKNELDIRCKTIDNLSVIRGGRVLSVNRQFEKCGEMTGNILNYLHSTSAELKTNYPTVTAIEHVCEHMFTTTFARVSGHIFKVALSSTNGTTPGQIEIFLFKYHIVTIYQWSYDGVIPVFMKPNTVATVTVYGTYSQYITGYGAYICKLFEYLVQSTQLASLPPGYVIQVNETYAFIGRLYEGLYPSEHLLTPEIQRYRGGALKKCKKQRSRQTRKRYNATHRKLVVRRRNPTSVRKTMYECI
jgi:hypothetical protein